MLYELVCEREKTELESLGLQVITEEYSISFEWNEYMYRVILKKVSFGIFSIIMVSKEEKDFTMKSKAKVLSLSKFS